MTQRRQHNDLADTIRNCFISPNVADSNLEPANLVDVVHKVALGLGDIAHAITPQDAAPAHTSTGGRVGSLTEAVIDLSENAGRIADAIGEVAAALRERG